MSEFERKAASTRSSPVRVVSSGNGTISTNACAPKAAERALEDGRPGEPQPKVESPLKAEERLAAHTPLNKLKSSVRLRRWRTTDSRVLDGESMSATSCDSSGARLRSSSCVLEKKQSVGRPAGMNLAKSWLTVEMSCATE